MKKILITGSNGFTGTYIKKAFEEQGYEVFGLAQRCTGSKEFNCDLANKEAILDVMNDVRPHGIIHLAAKAFVGGGNHEEFYKVNLFGTINLLEAINGADLKLEKLVVASSANVYGQLDSSNITEDVTPAPVNHYAISKLAMEHALRMWWHRIPMIITRPFNYTGQGQHVSYLIPKIVSHFKSGKTQIELGNVNVAREFSDVRDVAQAYLKLYECPAQSEIVNMCSGQTYKLSEIISLMSRIAGYEMEVCVNPDFVRPNEISVLGGECSKLLRLSGLHYSYTIEQTLESMYNEDLSSS